MESQKVESLEKASTMWYSEEESWFLRIVYMEIGALFTGRLSDCSFPTVFFLITIYNNLISTTIRGAALPLSDACFQHGVSQAPRGEQLPKP